MKRFETPLEVVDHVIAQYADQTALNRDETTGTCRYLPVGENTVGCAVGCLFEPEDRLILGLAEGVAVYSLYEKDMKHLFAARLGPTIGPIFLDHLQALHDTAPSVEEFRQDLQKERQKLIEKASLDAEEMVPA